MLDFWPLQLLIFPLLTALGQNNDGIQECGSGFRLVRNFLDDTLYPDARCADETIGGYYISDRDINIELEPNPPNLSFVIWLGDSPLCSGEDCTTICEGSAQETAGTGICEGVGEIIDENLNFIDIDETVARCLAARATCTTDWWEFFDEVTAGTILCEEDDFFGSFRRVFMPSCSLDYWLGNGEDKGIQDGSFSNTMFQGKFIFDGVIDTLIKKENLTFAEKIVFGGTRGGGIGSLHLVNSLRSKLQQAIDEFDDPNLEVPEILLLIDSSWIVSIEKFGPRAEERLDAEGLFVLNQEYRKNTSDWLSDATLLDSCFDKFSEEELFLCLFPSEVVKHHLNNNDPAVNTNRALFFQSQYDLFQLSDLGILEAGATEVFEDEVAFAQGALNFIENYGQQVRNSIDEVERNSQNLLNGERAVGFFSPSCGQHGFIVPTRIHTINARVENVGDAGSIQFQRDEFVWRNVAVGSTEDGVLRDFIVNFVENGVLPELQLDNCGEFLCNDACVTRIFPFVTEPVVGLCIQQLVLVYAAMLIFLFLLLFVSSYLRIIQWRRETRSFWRMIQSVLQNTQKDETNPTISPGKKFEVIGDAGNDEVEFLRFLAIQRDQTADEVQQQLIAETNANSDYRRAHLMARNLSYWAPPSKRSMLGSICSGRRTVGPHIIKDVSIAFEPGKVHALMGPSGSGKSTLLELLSHSKSSGTISGSRYINGVSTNSRISGFLKTWLKFNQSYVPQQDSFFSTLTVREHLQHAAWLILPEYMPTETKLNRVWQLIRLLDLSSCADTVCGDGGVTVEGGLSGGQRRRLSVATQLLSNPCVLFLDEPTSGLDSVSALNLCKRLQIFAKQMGMNVIMTIHQPRREIYSEIDKLYILVKGRLIFSGSVDRTARFFNLNTINPRLNVGNELLDLLKDVDDADSELVMNYLEKYHDSEEYAIMMKDIEEERTYLSPEVAAEVKETLVFNSLAEGRFSWRSPSSIFALQWVLLSRTLARGGLNIHVTVILAFIGGLILGGLFFQADNYDSKVGLAYLMVSTLTFFQGVFLARRYFDEKEVYDYERKAGSMNSWQAFIMTQYTKDAFTAFLESLAFAVPAYILGGFSLEIERGGNFCVLAVLIALATTSQNVFFQIERNETRQAAFLQIGFLGLGALFNGFIVQLDDLPSYYAWIPYVTLNFYGFVGVLINELADFTLPCNLSDLECASRTGDVVLQFFGYNDLDVFLCALALILIILLMRSLGIVVFYFKFARHSSLKRVGADGVSKPVANVVDEEFKGRTIQNVLNTQNPALVKMKTKKSVRNSSPDEEDMLEEFNSDALTSDILRPSKRMNHVKNQGAPEISKTVPGDEYDEDNSEFFDEDDEDSSPSLFDTSYLVSFITSTAGMVTLYLVDLASAGYICALSDETETLIIGISGAFLLLYLVQYVLQVAYVIPFTLEEEYTDFVWAFNLDGPSFLLFFIDAIAVFTQVSGVDDVFILQMITLFIRIVRLLRVQLFFMKVSRSHRIRAESFLAAKNKIVVEYIQQMNDKADEEIVNPTPISRQSGRDWLANLRSNEWNTQTGSKFGSSQMYSMPFKKAARRPISGAFGSQTNSQLSNEKQGRQSLGQTYITQQMNRYMQNANSQGTAESQQRPESGSSGSTYVKEKGWYKYRNDATGKMVYYNKYTGKYVDAESVDQNL